MYVNTIEYIYSYVICSGLEKTFTQIDLFPGTKYYFR